MFGAARRDDQAVDSRRVEHNAASAKQARRGGCISLVGTERKSNSSSASLERD
jgi:hypothetical protein